jgi:selenocysteine lyase/cysteine desulfurase
VHLGTAGRGGGDRGGLRASPHFYNTPEEIDRLVSAVGRYLKTGV